MRVASPQRTTEPLFDVPLPVPDDTVYRLLGIAPDSPAETIGWAIKVLNDRRALERRLLEERVRAVVAQVPGLEQAYAELDRLRSATGVPADATREAQQRVFVLEKRAVAIDPGILHVRQEIDELRRRIEDLNQLALDQPEKRRAYDQLHPPLGLLKLEPATRDHFLNTPRVLIALVRREGTRFLEQRGERALHASDLDREDFTADFTPTPVLDE